MTLSTALATTWLLLSSTRNPDASPSSWASVRRILWKKESMVSTLKWL